MSKAHTTKLPPLDPKAPGKSKQFRYQPQHGVVIVCESAADQQAIYAALKALPSRKLKVVVT